MYEYRISRAEKERWCSIPVEVDVVELDENGEEAARNG